MTQVAHGSPSTKIIDRRYYAPILRQTLEGQMGNTKAYFIALCILLATISQCVADNGYTSGKEILNGCRTAVRIFESPIPPNNAIEAYNAGMCTGSVRSLLQISGALVDQHRYCPPSGTVSVEQGVQVLVKYLETHPEKTHLSAERLAVDAFQAAWPCQ
jgi:hypothetical protein